MSLRVWLPLNGNLENKGISHTTVVNSGTTVNDSGKIGKCYSFASGNYIGLDANNVNNHKYSPISCALWVYPTQSDSTERYILGCWQSGGVGFLLQNQKIGWSIYVGNYINVWTPSTVTLNTWHHICGTYDGVNSCLYLDGTLIATTAISGTITYHATCPWELGGNPGATSFANGNFVGKLNDVRIYDHALSPLEVKEISQGLILHYPLNGYLGSGENILKNSKNEVSHVYNSSAILYYYFSFSGNLPTGTYTFSFDIKSTNGTDSCYCSYANGSSTIVRIATLTNIPTTYTRYKYTFTSSATNCNDIFFAHYTGHGSPTNVNNTGTIYVKNVKLERGDTATNWSPAPIDIGLDTTKVIDCSGYGNNGTISGTLSYISDSPRFDVSTKFDSTSSKIQLPVMDFSGMANSYTFAWWQYNVSTGNMPWGFSNGNRLNCYHTSPLCWNTGDGSNNKFKDGSTTIAPSEVQNAWHYMVVTGDGTSTKLYIDGVYRGTATTYKSLTGTQIWISGWDSGTSYTFSGSKECDFRIYATALSEADIKALYNTSASIDNLGNIHSFGFVENGSKSIDKNGIIHTYDIVEYKLLERLKYDKTIYKEPDGSSWIRVAHHNDPTTSGYFNRTDDWDNGVYLSADKWYNMDAIESVSTWEFMVKQKTTSSATETKYRWVQYKSPFTAAWADVKPGTVTFNTSTGYSSSSYGGLWQMNSNARLCIANGSSGNWYGAFGCWSTYNTNNIPGYPNTNISTGYMDLYIRVPDANIKDDGTFTANEFIEK